MPQSAGRGVQCGRTVRRCETENSRGVKVNEDTINPENIKREFQGIWIPKEIWFNRELSFMDKVFLLEIKSLDVGYRGCNCTNSYFGEFFGLSRNRCSEIISSLQKRELITVHVKKRMEKRGVVSERTIHINKKIAHQHSSKLSTPCRKIDRGVRFSDRGVRKTGSRDIQRDIQRDNIYSQVADLIVQHWNKSESVIHLRNPSDHDTISRITKTLESGINEAEILAGIDNYSKILSNPEKFWFSYRWTLKDFMKRGLDRFLISSMPLANFLKRKTETQNEASGGHASHGASYFEPVPESKSSSGG
jgi:hypothetical protein